MNNVPFNISVLVLTPEKLKGLIEVTSMDDFEGSTSNFHPAGLYSTEIFGKVGDERRNTRFSYIDIKIPILHPIIYNALIALKQLYGGIIAGTDYVIWNNEIKDFERADAITGKTGFAYFMEHWKNIDFKSNESDKREQNILLINKYKDIATTDKIVVMPAGLRDMEITADGRVQKNDINTFYWKFLSTTNTISDSAVKINIEVLNVARYSLQRTFLELYDTIEAMLAGKKKLILGKWASRRIFNGTRNVITAMDTSTPYLGAPGAISVNSTVIGLYQGLKTIMPIARFHIRNGFLSKVFISANMPVNLVDKKTRKMVSINVKPQYFDKWMTDEGIEKVLTSFGEEELRNLPLEVNGHYLGLIYKGPDMTFKIIQDIDEVPGTRSKLDVFPLTFCELLYLSCYKLSDKYPVIVTRYPVTGIGSCTPTLMHLATTIKTEQRKELSNDWEPLGDDSVAYEFPTKDGYVNSVSVHSVKIKGLGADFDGDTVSTTAVYSDEAIKEIHQYLGTKKAYVGSNGKFNASTGVDTVKLVLHNMTS